MNTKAAKSVNNSKMKVFELLESKLREFELMYNLSNNLSVSQKNKLKKQVLRIFEQS